ncbi:Uu.00g020810.m01.CDS01 [Anthostomella pinea]|uniref:Uu.00g020810.m01.CDS01 n=1 Tax=Anthostomella pinea TaxID=933095 RepID=A0AAI8VZJ5_9PEZI|nr:Uu.00g020810.m01.CDS01 [Anthostomella pinea]
MSRPTEPEIVAAITSFRQHIVEHNKQIFAKIIHEAGTAEAPASWPEEVVARARRNFMLHQLCVSRPDALAADDPRRIREPRDVLNRWDDLVAIPELALDGTVVEHDEAQRAILREQYRAGIVAGLKQQDDDTPPFPADFAVLMHHVDRLEGPGWPLWRENGQQVRFWDGLGEGEEAAVQRVWTDLDKLKTKAGEESWEVRAGWECGAGPDAYCFIIYFRDPDSDDKRRRSWAWRYVMRFDVSVWAFENVVELLAWYTTWWEPTLEDADFAGGPFH